MVARAILATKVGAARLLPWTKHQAPPVAKDKASKEAHCDEGHSLKINTESSILIGHCLAEFLLSRDNSVFALTADSANFDALAITSSFGILESGFGNDNGGRGLRSFVAKVC
jgi:hypothetical protein